MEDTSRNDIRRLLKIFGVQADEMILRHLIENPHAPALKLRIKIEDLTDYGDHPPAKPLSFEVEGEIRRQS
ncbi:MAG TPA: hypothetical protein DCE76_11070 [Anaerolineaceae bacterium]|jgi:hypothetical protein|nr:hypothetical protein [Anaerolineaceae bacterium]